MPLARIITNNDSCAHELALHLIARGYAVEIVSPDSIPDNVVDLELRLDTQSGNDLIANVKAHADGHSTSFDFVHHLKAPIGDSLGPRESIHPDIFRAERAIKQVETPDTPLEATPLVPNDSGLLAPPAAAIARPALTIAPPAAAIARPAVTIAPPTPTVALPAISSPVATQTTVAPIEPQPRVRTSGWYNRAALTFAGILLLALFLGFGIRRSSKISAGSSATAGSPKVAAASIAPETPVTAKPSAKELDQQLGIAAAGAPGQPEKNSARPTGLVPVRKTHAPHVMAATPRRRAEILPRHANDFVARDTVTYLDERYKPATTAHSPSNAARRQPAARKPGGVIAANTVTYLDEKPSPEPVK